jgi:tetratricopeptide (TPR) repeat protein
MIVGGALQFQNDVPVFGFVADRSLGEVQAALDHHYLELEVRFDAAGALAYHLGVPDRELGPWSIPVTAEQARRAARGAAMMNVCPTFIADGSGAKLDLSPFCMDLVHDWDGGYARALRAYQARDAAAASALDGLLHDEHAPIAAHRLRARLYREQGDLPSAIARYRVGLRLAVDAMGVRLLPVAAGVLSDLGVAYKRADDLGRAEACFWHSLALRPNHPQALLSLAATLGREDFARHAAARALAVQPRLRPLVESLLTNLAPVLGPPAAALARADDDAKAVDLAEWGWSQGDLGTLASIEAALDPKPVAPEPEPDRTTRRDLFKLFRK